MKKIDYLNDMYQDDYFPDFLVDSIKEKLEELVGFLETGINDKIEIQEKLDEVMIFINELQYEFNENDSDIETVARDSIGMTVYDILSYFDIDIDIETAIQERDW